MDPLEGKAESEAVVGQLDFTEDDEIRQSVERHGWHAIVVDESESAPGFLYTIGLGTSWNHPEIIVFGLPNTTAYSVIATVVERVRAGTPCSASGVHHGILDGLPVWIRPVHDSQLLRHFGFALGYYRLVERPSDLRAVQLFWPDSAGRLPNDPQCEPPVAASQPRLEIPAVSYE